MGTAVIVNRLVKLIDVRVTHLRQWYLSIPESALEPQPLLPKRISVIISVTATLLAAALWVFSPIAATGVVSSILLLLGLNFPRLWFFFLMFGVGLVWTSATWPTSPSKLGAVLMIAGTTIALLVRRSRPLVHPMHWLFVLYAAWALFVVEFQNNAAEGLGYVTTIAGWAVALIATHQCFRGARGLRSMSAAYVVGITAGSIMILVTSLADGSSTFKPVAGDVNDFALLSATATFFALGLLRERSFPMLVRIGFAACSVICAVEAIGSFSRGALLGLGAGVIVQFMVRPGDRRRILGVLVGFGAIALCLAPFVLNELQASLNQKAFIASTNVDTRLDAWGLGLRIFTQHPITGTGIGTLLIPYGREFGTAPGGFALAFAHNSYIEVLYGTGLVGMVIFMALMVFSVRNAWRVNRSMPLTVAGGGAASTLVAAMAVTLVASFTVTELMYAPLWLLLGFGISASTVSRPPPPPSTNSSDRTSITDFTSV